MLATLETLSERYPRGRRYLVGVSGGCDSVVLLHTLRHELGYERLVVVHVNHRLRGRASSKDASFVRRMATRLGLPHVGFSVAVRDEAAEKKLSLETAAREARHRCFAAAARQFRCSRVFLAHHLDDQVETVLMNLFRGAATAGLAGMAEETNVTVERRTLTLIRPLLSVSREELVTYALQHRLRFREDASNADPQFLRNRVRHDFLPYVTELFGRDPRPIISRLAEQQRELKIWLDCSTEAWSTEPELCVKTLRILAPAVRRHLLHRWLRRHGIRNVSYRLVNDAMGLLQPASRVAKLNLPGGGHLRRRAGRLFIDA